MSEKYCKCRLVLSRDERWDQPIIYQSQLANTNCNNPFKKSSEGDIKYFYREGLAPEAVTIKKAKVKSGKKLALSWKAAENAEGYEIVYSTNESFKKAKTKTVTGKTSAKVKKLKAKTYYVKVRAFSTDYAGNKVYGEYSDVKTVTIK